MNENKNIIELLVYLLNKEYEMNIDMHNKCFYLSKEAFNELYKYVNIPIENANTEDRVLGLPIKIDSSVVFAEIR